MKIPSLLLLAAGLAMAPLTTPAADSKPATGKKATVVRKVDVEEFDKLRADKSYTILDVRTAEEFKAGHIPGAINIDYNGPDFAEQVAKLDKSKTYLVHCAAGGRSAKACGKMDKAGFKSLIDLSPGFRAWEKAGKVVEK